MTDRELFAQAVVALEYHTQQTWLISNTNLAIEALRARLAQPEQEPLWIRNEEGKLELHAPPQREWIGLTDEEMRCFVDDFLSPEKSAREVFNAIETKLKEKNGF